MDGLVFELVMFWPVLVLPDPVFCFFRYSFTLMFAYLPSWPYSFEPQVKRDPSSDKAAVCRLPQLIEMIFAFRLETFIGTLCLRKSPKPSYPIDPPPQVYTSPSAARATVCDSPHRTSVMKWFANALTGLTWSSLSTFPQPNWPLLPRPQENTTPASFIAAAW